jgi:hypothetical protein
MSAGWNPGSLTPVRLRRRQLLRIGGIGLAGLSLPRLLAARESVAAPPPRADHCIILFLNGGPSHLDMWDLKPEAPAEIRGEFQPIETSLPGYQMGELLPRLARHAHRATVVRSMHHSVNNSHAAAVYCALTGHDRGEQGGGAKPSDNPAPGSVLSMFRPPERTIIPFVHLPYITKEGAGGPPQPGFFGGFLGAAWDPLFITRDPNAADFAVPELTLLGDVHPGRLAARDELLNTLDQFLQTARGAQAAAAMTSFQRRALELLTSPATQRAFTLTDEPDSVRDRYGRNIYGQSVLLARRLIEAGTRLVTVSWAPDANATWDTHGNNFGKLRNDLLPPLDAAASALLEDLLERGLLERTVVAILGDFGRTPKINGNAGRDHWNWCYSLMLLGGGFRQGYLYGASDETGAYPARDPLTPGDVLATLYHALGVPPDGLIYDPADRPHRIVPAGEVIADLLA